MLGIRLTHIIIGKTEEENAEDWNEVCNQLKDCVIYTCVLTTLVCSQTKSFIKIIEKPLP